MEGEGRWAAVPVDRRAGDADGGTPGCGGDGGGRGGVEVDGEGKRWKWKGMSAHGGGRGGRGRGVAACPRADRPPCAAACPLLVLALPCTPFAQLPEREVERERER